MQPPSSNQAHSSRIALGSSPGFPGSLYDAAQNGMPVKLEDDASYLTSNQTLSAFMFGQSAELGAWQPQTHTYSAGRTQIHA